MRSESLGYYYYFYHLVFFKNLLRKKGIKYAENNNAKNISV